MGGIASFCLVFFTKNIIAILKWPNEIYYSLLGLSLAPILVSLMSAFRGFFQGTGNMIPTGISTIIERIGRVVIGIGLVYYLLEQSMDLGTVIGGATFGATAGAFLGVIFLVIIFVNNCKNIIIILNNRINAKESSLKIIKGLLKIAIPISLGSFISSFINFVDSAMLPNSLTQLHESKYQR